MINLMYFLYLYTTLQICNNGRCISEHENIIPDYSQNTPAYIRRSDDDSAATQPRPIYSYLNSTTQR